MLPLNPPPPWLQWLQTLSVPILAAIGAIIAYQQFRIARTKLQHDVFDRRIQVYYAIREALADIAAYGDIKQENLSSLYAVTSAAPFLFPRSFSVKIRDIERRVSALFTARRDLEKIDDLPAHAKKQERLLDEEKSHKAWLRERLETLTLAFEPHIHIGPT